MATLAGNKPKDTYGDLLQVSNSGEGLDATAKVVEDGKGDNSALWISTTEVKSSGKLQVGTGTPISATDVFTVVGDMQIQNASADGSGSDLKIYDDNQATYSGYYVDIFAQTGHGYLKSAHASMDLNIGAGAWGEQISLKAGGGVVIGKNSHTLTKINSNAIVSMRGDVEIIASEDGGGNDLYIYDKDQTTYAGRYMDMYAQSGNGYLATGYEGTGDYTNAMDLSLRGGYWGRVAGGTWQGDNYYNAMMHIDGGTGLFGIGTVAPASKLDILSDANPQLRLTHTSASKFTTFEVDTSHHLKVVPSSTGKVIIGNTSAINSDSMFVVKGDMEIHGGTGGNGSDLYIYDNDQVTYPARYLDLNAQDGDGYLSTAYEGTGDYTNAMDLKLQGGFWGRVGGAGTWTGNDYRNALIHIDGGTGLIGIGNVTPDSKLDIFDDTGAQLRLTHTDATKYATFQVDTNSNLIIQPSGAGNVQITSADDSPSFKVVGDDPDIVVDINTASSTHIAEYRFAEEGVTKGYIGYRKDVDSLDVVTHTDNDDIRLIPNGTGLIFGGDNTLTAKSVDSKVVLQGDVEIHSTTTAGDGCDLRIYDKDQATYSGRYVDVFAQAGNGHLKTNTADADLILGAGAFGANFEIDGSTNGNITLAPMGTGKVKIATAIISGAPSGSSMSIPIVGSDDTVYYIEVKTTSP